MKIIGEKINGTRQRVAQAIEERDSAFIQDLAVKQAEAEGRFRRLVPLDEVGWDNPLYKNPNPPRFVIQEE